MPQSTATTTILHRSRDWCRLLMLFNIHTWEAAASAAAGLAEVGEASLVVCEVLQGLYAGFRALGGPKHEALGLGGVDSGLPGLGGKALHGCPSFATMNQRCIEKACPDPTPGRTAWHLGNKAR